MSTYARKPRFVFTIWYLENEKKDFQLFKNKSTAILERLLQERLNSQYASSDEHCPRCKVEFKWFKTVEELREAVGELIQQPRKLTLSEPCLILLDYYLDTDSEGRPVALPKSLEAWLTRMMPTVPFRILTQLEFGPELGDKYLPKASILRPHEFAGKLESLLLKYRPEFWEKLREYANRQVCSWHTPGHNKGAAFECSAILHPFYSAYSRDPVPMVFASDLSVSVAELGDLSEPDGDLPMATAMRRARDVFGAHRTLFCTNGTSTSNRALLTTLLRPDDVVLVDRNCHKSVHQAVVMSGAIPFYLAPEFNTALGLWKPLSMTQIFSGIDEAASFKPRLIVLTSCTYDGILLPIKEIAQRSHERGILLYADEAWFPYGRFHPYYGSGPSEGRYNGLDSNADFCVHSSHKALAAFSQASMLHVGASFRRLFDKDFADAFDWLAQRYSDYETFEHQLMENLRFWLSTSPHYPMIATLDAATAQMNIEGPALLGKLLEHSERLRAWARTTGCEVTREDLLGGVVLGYEKYGYDPLKFTVRIKHGQRSAFLHCLEEHKHQCEKSTDRTALFLLTVGTKIAHVEDLKATLELCRHQLGNGTEPKSKARKPDVQGQVVLLPRDAHYSTGHYMTLEDIGDHIRQGDIVVGCQMVTPYPPGIPTILPGLRVTLSSIEWIAELFEQKREVHGLRVTDNQAKIRILLESDDEFKRLSARQPEVVKALTLRNAQ